MITARTVLTVLGLLVLTSLTFTHPAAAHDCNIYTNPGDCQNTAWTIGVIATLAGGVAVAAAATLAANREPGDVDRNDSAAPDREGSAAAALPPVGYWIDHVEVRPFSDPPSVTIEPSDGVVRDYSVRIEAHRDPGRQSIREVNREHD